MPPEILEQLNSPRIFSRVRKLGLMLVPSKSGNPDVDMDHIERPFEDQE